MKRIRYTKYVPDPAGEMSLEDLLGALSDYLLQSGFQDYLSYYDLPNGEQTLDDLKRAIERALLESEMLNDEMREQLQQMQAEGSLDDLIETKRDGEEPAHRKTRTILAPRRGQPSDISSMVRHLAGPNGRYITGQTIHISGGAYLP